MVTVSDQGSGRNARRRNDVTCPRCGLIVTASERRDGHTCSHRASPETAAHYATLARNAAKAGATVAKARANNHEGNPT